MYRSIYHLLSNNKSFCWLAIMSPQFLSTNIYSSSSPYYHNQTSESTAVSSSPQHKTITEIPERYARDFAKETRFYLESWMFSRVKVEIKTFQWSKFNVACHQFGGT